MREKKHILGHIDFALIFFLSFLTKDRNIVGLPRLTEECGLVYNCSFLAEFGAKIGPHSQCQKVSFIPNW